MSYLNDVLKSLDATRDDALVRLFELLKIPSISTDPQFKVGCQEAAQWCAKQLTELGFDAGALAAAGAFSTERGAT